MRRSASDHAATPGNSARDEITSDNRFKKTWASFGVAHWARSMPNQQSRFMNNGGGATKRKIK